MGLTDDQPTFVGQWSYDSEGHWLVFTEDGGASAIVAYDVPSTWAARMLPLLNRDDAGEQAAYQWIGEAMDYGESRETLTTGELRTRIAAEHPCASCGHGKVHHFGGINGKDPRPPVNEGKCWAYRCGCGGWLGADTTPMIDPIYWSSAVDTSGMKAVGRDGCTCLGNDACGGFVCGERRLGGRGGPA